MGRGTAERGGGVSPIRNTESSLVLSEVEGRPRDSPSDALRLRAARSAQDKRAGPVSLRSGPDALRRLPAILGAFPAHLRAQLAMLMIVPLALGRAFLADPRAQLEHLAHRLLVHPGLPKADVGSGVANRRAVEAPADALDHVEVLGQAGVRARQAHLGAIHQVVDRIPERLVDVPLNVRVKRNHLPNRHEPVLPSLSGASEEQAQRFRPGMRSVGHSHFGQRPPALLRVEYQMSGAGDGFPGLADEKVRSVPSQLMNGRASKSGELSDSSWIAGPNGCDVLERVE